MGSEVRLTSPKTDHSMRRGKSEAMSLKQRIAQAFAVAAVVFSGSMAARAAHLRAGALVLVNSAAPDYGEFQNRLEP